MGVLDDLSNTFTKGTVVVERNARILVLKTKIGEAQSRRSSAVSALGADLYQQFYNNPEVRAGREQLFDNVTNCDNEIADLQAQVRRLEAEAASATSEIPMNQAYQNRAAQQVVCPSCGSTLSVGARFCHACGAQVPVPAPAADPAPVVTPTPETEVAPTAEPVTAPECAREPEMVEAVAGVYEVPSDVSENRFYVESKPQVAVPAEPVQSAQPVHPAEVQPNSVPRD